MEQREDVLLHASQVDQDVAATDQVQLRKRRIVDQVMPGKDAHLAQVLVDLVAAFDLREIAVQALMGKVRRNVLEVPAGAGLFDCRLADIGSEDLHRKGGARFVQVFL